MDELMQNPSIFDSKRYFEWKSGPDIGVVEVYVAELNEVVWFESGRNCSKENIDFLMKEINEQEYNLKKSVKLEALPMTQFQEVLLGNPEPPKVEANPIRIILDKQKKFDLIDLTYEVSVKIPSTKVIDLLGMMFDEDEVSEEIGKFVMEKIDENMLNDFKNFIIDNIKAKLNITP